MSNPAANYTIIPRHRAAMLRYKPSRPVQRAIEWEFINQERTIFDYGCGKGFDAEWLSEQGYPVVGRYDPYYFPKEPILPADVVFLNFVLNTIENKAERESVLARTYELANHFLIVGFLTDTKYVAHRASDNQIVATTNQAIPYGDGYINKKLGTFEKAFTAGECVSYVRSILGVTPQRLDSGIYAVQKTKTKIILPHSLNDNELTKLLAALKKQRQRLLKKGNIAPEGAYLQVYSRPGKDEMRFRLRSPNCNLSHNGKMVKWIDLGDDIDAPLYKEVALTIERRDKLDILNARIAYFTNALRDKQARITTTNICIAPPPTYLSKILARQGHPATEGQLHLSLP